MLSLTVNDVRVAGQLDDFSQRQLPFATANTINDTALDFQQAERRHISNVFHLRREDFLFKQGVKMLEFATKYTLRAVIGMDPKADFLAKFESGDTKVPTRSSALAIPPYHDIGEVQAGAPRPRSLTGSSDVFVVEESDNDHLPPGIYRRDGNGLTLLYSLKPQAPIEAVLEYESIARQTVDDNFATHFEAEFAKALATAR